ncbi:MAG: PilZ domain-containing protein [Pseudomonadota bacterium]
MNSQTTERRRRQRLPVDLPVRLHLPGGAVAAAKMINLSASGAGILHPEPVASGTAVELQFSVRLEHASREIKTKGIVRHNAVATVTHGRSEERYYVIGIEFLSPRQEDAMVIEAYLGAV